MDPNELQREPPPLISRIPVADIPETGIPISYQATPDECSALADFAGLKRVQNLDAQGQISPTAHGFRLDLKLTAQCVQSCVVTLTDVQAKVDEVVERNFSDQVTDLEDGDEEELGDPSLPDPPEALPGDELDLGAILTEHLILALDPYPRATDAAFDAPASASEEGRQSPFAKLAALKNPN